jgi:Trypsin
MRFRVNPLVSAAIVALFSCASSAAESTKVFYAVSDLTYDSNSKPVLINARAANPGDFPATFYAFSSGGPCTSTLVGPRVLMTAAHCVTDGEVVAIAKGSDQFKGQCSRAKAYPQNPTADWALCALDGEPPGLLHETVNTNSGVLQKDLFILLSGFGCVSSSGLGGSDGTYRIGTSKISLIPAGDNNDIQSTGGAAVCFGDSGGPAFIVSKAAIANPATTNVLAKRLLVSVNSRGNIRDTSFLASTSTPVAQAFLKEWTDNSGLKICGFSSGVTQCRELP